MLAPSTPGQRFTQLIQQLGITKNAFAQSLGKTATVIQHIVDERNKPGYDLLNRVCEVYPNVASDWLVLGKGAMLRSSNPPAVPAGETSAASPAPALNGIDPADIPGAASRRRTGALLQPADVAATLALASLSSGNGPGTAPAERRGPTAAATLPAPAGPAPATPPAVAAAPTPGEALSLMPPSEASASYLAAALQTQHLQHQLALAEQRNQHLLEQQALLKQMVALLQKTV